MPNSNMFSIPVNQNAQSRMPNIIHQYCCFHLAYTANRTATLVKTGKLNYVRMWRVTLLLVKLFLACLLSMKISTYHQSVTNGTGYTGYSYCNVCVINCD